LRTTGCEVSRASDAMSFVEMGSEAGKPLKIFRNTSPLATKKLYASASEFRVSFLVIEANTV